MRRPLFSWYLRCNGWSQEQFRTGDGLYVASFLLKEKGREVNEVVAPDQPGVQAGSFNLRDRHLFCLEEVDQFAIGLDEIVLGSAGYPEKAEVGGFGVDRCQLLGVVEIVDS